VTYVQREKVTLNPVILCDIFTNEEAGTGDQELPCGEDETPEPKDSLEVKFDEENEA
jgi:hypothetical protein